MPDENPEQQHNVFISWSGDRSRYVAEALREWLPMVIQAANPFLSRKDIDKGSRWHIELARALEVMKVGIVCLSPENLSAPWLLFESGALSKTVDRGTRVCTYLLAGLKPQEVPPPLSEFQATKAEREETLQMLQVVNKALGSPLRDQTLNNVFEPLWPQLEAKISTLPNPEISVPPKRNIDDMVAEVLEILRTNKKRQEEERIHGEIQETVNRVLEASAKKAVLILGRFTPERKALLDSIQDALRHLGFLPILFDFDAPTTRDTHETILILAGLSRFVIADITDPKSIPQELASIVPNLPSVPVQPLLQAGHEPWGMYDHIKRYPWVLPLVEYKSQETLLRDLEQKVIAPAEEKAKELTRR